MGNYSAAEAIAVLRRQLDAGTFDPDAWTTTGPTPVDSQSSATLYAGNMGADVVLRRLRTESGFRHATDYFFQIEVLMNGQISDSHRTDDLTSDLATVIAQVESVCSAGPTIVNNHKFTGHVLEVLRQRMASGDIDGSAWISDGPCPVGTVVGSPIAYTAVMGSTDVTLTRSVTGVEAGGAPHVAFSISVVRDDTVIGLLSQADPAGQIGALFNDARHAHNEHVAALQARARRDFGVE